MGKDHSVDLTPEALAQIADAVEATQSHGSGSIKILRTGPVGRALAWFAFVAVFGSLGTLWVRDSAKGASIAAIEEHFAVEAAMWESVLEQLITLNAFAAQGGRMTAAQGRRINTCVALRFWERHQGILAGLDLHPPGERLKDEIEACVKGLAKNEEEWDANGP